MTALSEYISDYVKPTFEDFKAEPGSRRSMLCALTIYHAIDRAKVDRKAAKSKLPKGTNLRNVWAEASMGFMLMDAICHNLKHKVSDLLHVKPRQWNPEPVEPGQKVPEVSIEYVLSRMNPVEFTATAAGAIMFLESIDPSCQLPPPTENHKHKLPPLAAPKRTDFLKYIDMTAVPTLDDFRTNPQSVRHAFLACVAAYHAIDRAAPRKQLPALGQQWRKQSLGFLVVDMVAHHFKHTKSSDEQRPALPGAVPLPVMVFGSGAKAAISRRQTLTDGGIELHNLFFLVRDAIAFLGQQAPTVPV